MIHDKLATFADALAIPIAFGDDDVVLGDMIDLGATNAFPGNGEPIYLVVRISTAVTSGGAATVQFKIQSAAAAVAAGDTLASPTTHFASDVIGKATLVAGYTAVAVALPKGTYKRYLAVVIDVGTADLTAGAADAFLTTDVNEWRAFANAI